MPNIHLTKIIDRSDTDTIIGLINTGYDLATNGYEALEYAILTSNMPIISLLLKNIDSVNDKNIIYSIFNLAIKSKDMDLLDYLVQNYDIQCNDIMCDWICMYGSVEIVDYLLNTDKICNIHGCLVSAIHNNKIEIIKYLLSMGVAITDTDYDLILRLALNLNYDMIFLLLNSDTNKFTRYDDLLERLTDYNKLCRSVTLIKIIDYVSTLKMTGRHVKNTADLV